MRQFPAHVLLSQTTHFLDDNPDYHPSTEEMWESKLDESVKSGLAGAIQDEGLKYPVSVAHYPETGETVLEDGHHRLITAAAINPDMPVPVAVRSQSGRPEHNGRGISGLYSWQDKQPVRLKTRGA